MADPLQDWIDKARQAQYGDDELKAYFTKAGYPQETIDKYFKPTPAFDPSKDIGFGREWYEKNIRPLGDLTMMSYQANKQGDLPGFLGRVAGGMGVGMYNEFQDQRKQAWAAIIGKDPVTGKPLPNSISDRISSGIGHTIGMIPILGPQLAEMGEKYTAGKPGEARADLLSILGQGYGGEAMKALGAPFAARAATTYKKAFQFPEAMSIPEMDAATELALKNRLSAGKGGINALGHVNDPNSLMGQWEAQVSNALKAHGGEKIKRIDVVGPLRDEIFKAGKADVIGADMRNDLKEYLDNFLYDKVPTPRGGIKKVPRPDMYIQDAQDIKRGIYYQLSPAVYSDSAKALPPAKALAGRSLASGLKDKIAELAPEVSQPNNDMHNGIQLQDRMAQIEKRNPGWAQDWIPWVIGISSQTTGAAVGHPLAGTAVLSAIAMRQALRDPKVGTRLAIAMKYAGQGPIAQTLGLAGPNIARAELLREKSQ